MPQDRPAQMTEKSRELMLHLEKSGAAGKPVFIGEDPAVQGRSLGALRRRGFIEVAEDGGVVFTEQGLEEVNDLLGLI
jgi:ABC-type metal ion transport system substrate-binding protein